MAAAIHARPWTKADIAKAIQEIFQSPATRPITRLAGRILKLAASHYSPSPDVLAQIIRQQQGFHQLCKSAERRRRKPAIFLEPPRFNPTPRFADLDIPPLVTSTDLAEWLELNIADLFWFADQRRMAGRTNIPVLQNYRYQFANKRHGPPRLIEAPKPRLRAIQKRILRSIIDKVPTHDAAHGFVAGRSVLSGAQIHGGEDVVICADLKDFFLTTPVRRVHGIFRSLGYPWFVARLLTGLCTSSTPMSVFKRLPLHERHDWRTQNLYAHPHLPAGAPTSPALANLAASALDARLAGLTRQLGANYTRYADDLTFSGEDLFARQSNWFLHSVSEICADEEYQINPIKTRVMSQSGRQQVTGVVVNQHTNIARPDYDRLKATLFNCARRGPEAENRENHADFRAHLNGRVTWAENVNPNRGSKLRELFNQINWDVDGRSD